MCIVLGLFGRMLLCGEGREGSYCSGAKSKNEASAGQQEGAV